MATVYEHIRNDTGEVFYVGISKYDRDETTRTWRPYGRDSRSAHWHSIVKKAGYSVNIVVEGLTVEEAKEMEISLISEYGRDNLTNHTDGGDGCVNLSEEALDKIRTARAEQVMPLVTHCKAGHPREEWNGDRCSICKNRRNREYRARKGLKGRKKTHCKYGHEFTEENTRTDKKGHRRCRTCNAIRNGWKKRYL